MKQIFHKPPILANLLFRNILPESDTIFLRGDFDEIFNDLVAEKGMIWAKAWYWSQLIVSVPEILITVVYWRIAMIHNYLKIALRNMLRYKFYSMINVIGLAVGIACCLLIMLYIQHELSYDRYHEKADRIYRLAVSLDFGGSGGEIAVVGAPTAAALVNDYPEVLDATRFQSTGNWYIRYGETTFKETRLVYTDANVFDVFTIPLLQGDPKTALAEPNTIVISETMADKYFGMDDPLGKTLNLDATTDYEVTGVFREIPSNTHFHYDFFASMATIEHNLPTIWLSLNWNTYIVLKEGADAEALEAKFPEMAKKYCEPEFQRFVNASWEEVMESGGRLDFYLQPVTKIHLHSDLLGELEPNSDIKYVYIFSVIVFFILVIACINFMNLSTARSANRAREVGIRKVVGSLRSQLVRQFLAESVVLSVIALFIAVLLVGLTLSRFNDLAGKELSIRSLTNNVILFSFFLMIVFVGLIAGTYPAFFLSAFKPVTVLRQKLGSGVRGRWMRRALVVFQFTMSIVLIIGTIVVFKQLKYVQNRKLGFDKEQVFILHDAFILGSQIESFKNELLQNPEIVSGTVSGYLPVTSDRSLNAVIPEGRQEETTPIQTWWVDFDYVKTLGLEIVEGRDFSRALSTDSSAVIINEAAAKHFGWDEPLGKTIGSFVAVDTPVIAKFTVIGVVRDFHYESLRNQIGPFAMFIGRSTGLISFRLKTENLSEIIRFIEDKWNAFAPGQPLEYSFLDDRFDEMYRAEQRIGRIFGIFAALAIFVGCLGLFGLAAFTAEQRTKEIGIRKVLGASISGIVLLMSKEFFTWVVVANIVAWPIACIVMNKWLQGFAYRTSITVWTFALSAILALIVALLTVSYQAIKAARSNPVDSLKYE